MQLWWLFPTASITFPHWGCFLLCITIVKLHSLILMINFPAEPSYRLLNLVKSAFLVFMVFIQHLFFLFLRRHYYHFNPGTGQVSIWQYALLALQMFTLELQQTPYNIWLHIRTCYSQSPQFHSTAFTQIVLNSVSSSPPAIPKSKTNALRKGPETESCI